MVLHDGNDDLIARLHHRLTEGEGDEVKALCGATGEDDLRRALGIEKPADGLTRLLMQLRGFHTEVVHAAVHVGVGVEILLTHGVKHAQRLLRRCGIVEIDQWLAVNLTA